MIYSDFLKVDVVLGENAFGVSLISKPLRVKGKKRSCDVYLFPPFVVDSGIGKNVVSEKIKEIGKDKFRYMFLTHSHFDHIKNASMLKEKFDLTIIAHKLTKKAVEENIKDLTLSNGFDGEISDLKIDKIVKMGDRFGDFEVIETPGHSDCSISLYNKKEKICFIGDLFFPKGRLGRTDLPTGNIGKMKESIERLNKLNIDEYYCGHGGKANKSDIKRAFEKIKNLNERDL